MSRYGAVLVDPPWSSLDFGSGLEAYRDWPYGTMRLREIVDLPVADLVSEEGHLWLWSTNSTLPGAFWLFQRWGFTYMNVVTWVKPSGFGFWWANAQEHLLFGYRGRLRMGRKLLPTVVFEPRAIPGEHSTKPERFVSDYVEQVSSGPFLELFARRQRPGWDVWGDEVDGVDIFSIAGRNGGV